jgi:hypothetical protein
MPKFTEDEARAAIAGALCWSDALRTLGLRTAGGNHRTLQRWSARWGIDASHFDANAVRRRTLGRAPTPLDEILIERSPFGRQTVKRRLLEAGLKQPVCELCGQGELWQGRRMAMILDHINGVADDHRLENPQMVCPNCAATLETHCGRQNRSRHQRFCSQDCAYRRQRGVPQTERRRVRRPPYPQLQREIHARVVGGGATVWGQRQRRAQMGAAV